MISNSITYVILKGFLAFECFDVIDGHFSSPLKFYSIYSNVLLFSFCIGPALFYVYHNIGICCGL